MKELTFFRGDFAAVQDGSDDTFFDKLLDDLSITRNDDIDEVNIEVVAYSFN